MNYREKYFSWCACELCPVVDKQAHYFVNEAKRNGLHVVEINNRYYALIINEYSYRG